MAVCFVNGWSGRSSVAGGKTRRVCTQTPSAEATIASEQWDLATKDIDAIVEKVKFDANGLVPAIAQQHDTGEILMMAWMNAESIRETLKLKRAVYYSRSRKELWRKGDTSGQYQKLYDFRVDCDADTLLLKVDQLGVACHTGRRSCFYFAVRGNGLEAVEPVITDPSVLYGSNAKH